MATEDAADADERGAGPGDDAGGAIRGSFHRAAVTGLAVLVPLVVTLLVLQVVVGYLLRVTDPLVAVVRWTGVGPAASAWIVRGVVVGALAVFVVVLGFTARNRYGEHVVDAMDEAVTAVPAVGTIYDSFRQMSDALLRSDTENFRDVKLVEFPGPDTYTLGFETAHTPEPLREAAGEDEMLTVFLPLAPNPVMGGHLVHVPAERVLDVDMTVEEGLRTVVTSGVATGEAAPEGAAELDDHQLERIAGADVAERRLRDEPDASEADPRTEEP